ncbi:MAG: ABC transporter permease [Terriglobales bacterium]
METLIQDIRYGWRMLAKSPGFTTVVILMLALGIGANTAVFTILSATLLRALPFEKPDELVQISQTRTSGSFQQMEASYPNYLDMRDHSQVFSRLGGYSNTTATLSGKDGAEQIPIAVASSGFFEALGVRPSLGRTFAPAEDGAQEQTVILTHGGWQRRFGGDPHIVGKTLTLDGALCTIVGVLPETFQFGPSRSADVWRSLHLSGGMLERRNLYWFHPVGRLKPGINLQQAQAGMQTLAGQLEAQYPDSNRGVGIQLLSLRDQLTGSIRPVLLMLMGSVGFVLLITCANVAGLLLARSVPRQREIAVRVALGAARARIIRQLLTEGILLALLGGAAGVMVAAWSVPAILSAIPRNQIASLPALVGLGVDRSVLLFSLALSVVTGILFGMAPALQIFNSNVSRTLQESGRSSVSSPHSGLRNALVVGEISLAIALLVGAGLMLNSLRHVLNVDPGFKTDHLLTLSLALPDKSYPDDPRALVFTRQLLQNTNRLPGVKEAAAVSVVPLSGSGNTSRFDLEGHPKASGGGEYEANSRTISANYFRVMGIPLRAGRFFTEQDNGKSPNVVIVNQALADMAFPHQNPIGKRINFTYTNEPHLWQIIGVVGNESVTALDAHTTPVIYDNFEQDASGYFAMMVRTGQEPTGLADAVRRAIREIDPQVPVFGVASMHQVIADSPTMLLRAYPAYLVGALAGIALLLAALGIYGLLAYSVAQRTRELGLRMALGAQPWQLVQLVLRNGLRLTLIGTALGLMGAFAAGRLISSLLFGITPGDFATFLEGCLLLLFVVLPATYIPARRAMRVDPMLALRDE